MLPPSVLGFCDRKLPPPKSHLGGVRAVLLRVRQSRRLWLPLLAAALLCVWSGHGYAADTAQGCAVVGRVVSVQGMLEIKRAGQDAWSRVRKLDTPVCQGDLLHADPKSRAAVLIDPETLVRLDQNSTIAIRQTPDETVVEFSRNDATLLAPNQCGAGYFVTRFPRRFRVLTPFVSAVVEGTEFLVAMRCESAEVAVFEGRVRAQQTLVDSSQAVSLTNGQSYSAGGAEPPAVKVLVKPADAVQWALYYPPLSEPGPGVGPDQACDQASSDEKARCLTTRAEQRLRVGRVDEARADIEASIGLAPENADAAALSSVINVVKNDKRAALASAQQATQLAAVNPRTWIALSYAQQASFKLEEALASAERAAELSPQSSTAQARVAELLMSLGRIKSAERAAQAAVDANPNESRANTILGFVHLAQIDTKKAREDFLNAIERDSSDPLPRLGLGLAIIRGGNLKAGREQIEIAVALDPTNSLIRSYVGKAYYEENTKERDKLAATQLGIAKQLDPKDPTPWFYDAILKQTQNRPVEALEDLRKSIELNDNHAVYRSRLLLDQDRASREVSVARIYTELGLDQLALSQAAESLSLDPASTSAHRFLSDVYSESNRHEIGRVSELLQAQLLQPLNMTPVPPSFPFTGLNSLPSVDTTSWFLSDYSQLFEQGGVRLLASALAGNHDTLSDEVTVSALTDKLALSVGQYYYATDGFRPNNDSTNEIYNAFVQISPNDILSLQAEYRQRHTENGDIVLNFDPAQFAPQDRFLADQETSRIGFRLSPSASVRVLGSVIFSTRRETQLVREDGEPDINLQGRARGTSYEIQGQYLQPPFNVIIGGGSAPVDQTVSLTADFTKLFGISCPFPPCSATTESEIHQQNAYAYVNISLSTDLIATLGLSHDVFDDGSLDLRKWDPKVGLQWQANNALRIRAAAFSTLKRALVVEQTIEPTQVAGFSQFFDDLNGTTSKALAAAADLWFNRTLQGSIEVLHRDLTKSPGLLGLSLAATTPQDQSEDTGQASLSWIPRKDLVLNVGYVVDNFHWDATEPTGGLPVSVRTTEVPLGIKAFLRDGLSAGVRATYVRQDVERVTGPPSESGTEHFATVDLDLGYLLPQRRGAISVGVRNLFDRQFSFQDDNYRTSTYRTPRYIPARNAFLKVSLVF